MNIPLDTTDRRSLKALVLAEGAARWEPFVAANGEKFYRVPSQADPRVRYLVNCGSCDCPDHRPTRPCKHQLAVRLHVGRVKAQHEVGPAPERIAALRALVANQ